MKWQFIYIFHSSCLTTLVLRVFISHQIKERFGMLSSRSIFFKAYKQEIVSHPHMSLSYHSNTVPEDTDRCRSQQCFDTDRSSHTSAHSRHIHPHLKGDANQNPNLTLVHITSSSTPAHPSENVVHVLMRVGW